MNVRNIIARTLLVSALLALGLAALRPAQVQAFDDPGAGSLFSVSVPGTVSANSSYSCTVSLPETATADTVVNLTASGDGEFTVPSHVVVLEGQSSAGFSLDTGAHPGFSGASITVQASTNTGNGPVVDSCQALWADPGDNDGPGLR